MGILCAVYIGIAFSVHWRRSEIPKYVEVTSTKFPCSYMLKPFAMNIFQVTFRKKFGAKRGEGRMFYSSPHFLGLKAWIVEQPRVRGFNM